MIFKFNKFLKHLVIWNEFRYYLRFQKQKLKLYFSDYWKIFASKMINENQNSHFKKFAILRHNSSNLTNNKVFRRNNQKKSVVKEISIEIWILNTWITLKINFGQSHLKLSEFEKLKFWMILNTKILQN